MSLRIETRASICDTGCISDSPIVRVHTLCLTPSDAALALYHNAFSQVYDVERKIEIRSLLLRLEPHPDDFVEDGLVAVDMVRGINSPLVSFLYCAPHTFHMGGNMAEIMEYAGPLMTQLHLADAFDHTASSGLRYIVNPPGSTARVHQHLDIGQGEVDRDTFFGTLGRLGFGDRDDAVMTVCVFAWEDRARESSVFMRERIATSTKGW